MPFDLKYVRTATASSSNSGTRCSWTMNHPQSHGLNRRDFRNSLLMVSRYRWDGLAGTPDRLDFSKSLSPVELTFPVGATSARARPMRTL